MKLMKKCGTKENEQFPEHSWKCYFCAITESYIKMGMGSKKKWVE